jgi:hypothetical protein
MIGVIMTFAQNNTGEKFRRNDIKKNRIEKAILGYLEEVKPGESILRKQIATDMGLSDGDIYLAFSNNENIKNYIDKHFDVYKNEIVTKKRRVIFTRR